MTQEEQRAIYVLVIYKKIDYSKFLNNLNNNFWSLFIAGQFLFSNQILHPNFMYKMDKAGVALVEGAGLEWCSLKHNCLLLCL